MSRENLIDELNRLAFELHEAYNTGIITDNLIHQFNNISYDNIIFSGYHTILESIKIHYPITTTLGDVITYRERANYASIQINNKLLSYRVCR